MPDIVATTCPYCGEPIELIVDGSAGSTEYVEDCPVCCHPMRVTVEVNGADVALRVHTDSE